MWRVCRACLPTAVSLVFKRVDISPICSWCLCRQEDAVHVLLDCFFSRSVWTNLGLQELINDDREGDILDIIQQLFDTYSVEKLTWIVIVCWNLWNRRNKLVVG